MKYIYIPKVYNSLSVHNRQNNTLTAESTSELNKSSGQGIRISPFLSAGLSNQVTFSFCVKPTDICEFFRLFSFGSNNAQSRNAILSSSGLTAGTGFASIGSRGSGYGVSLTLGTVLSNTDDWTSVIFSINGTSATKSFNLYVNGYIWDIQSQTNTFNYVKDFIETYFFRDFVGKIRSFQIWNSFFNSNEASLLHGAMMLNQESLFATSFSSKNLFKNFIFESDKIVLGNAKTILPANGWTCNFSPSVVGITGTTTASNALITGISSTAGIVANMAVYGTNIPIGSVVNSVTANSVTISKNATASGTVSNLAFHTRNAWRIGSAFSSVTGGQSLYVSCDGGQTAGYLNSNQATYAYRDFSVSSQESVLSLECFVPRDGSGSQDFLKVIVANTSFTPSNGTDYTNSTSDFGSYGNPNIIKQFGTVFHSVGGHGNLNDIKKINYDLSDLEGRTVRIVVCFRSDGSNNTIEGTSVGFPAILSAKMVEKSTIEGSTRQISIGQLISNGNFESGSTSWSFANQANGWFVGTADKYFGTRSLYISGDSGATSSYITNTTVGGSHAWTDIVLSDQSPKIKFFLKVGGENPSTYLDGLRIRVMSREPSSSNPNPTPVAGSMTISGTSLYDQSINLTGGWSLHEIDLTGAFSLFLQARLIFSWKNDSSSGTQPGAVIDMVSTSASSGVTLGGYEPEVLPMIFNSAEFSDDKPSS